MPDTRAVAPATRPKLAELEDGAAFRARHIGPSEHEQVEMARLLGFESPAALVDAVVPAAIRLSAPMALPAGRTEAQALAAIRAIASRNLVFKSWIGQGYYGTHTPGVILRNVLENPAWYTAYTPYQPEISQGRLEALINFQTMVCDLTGMAIANASMLDEATAAAEAMTLCLRSTRHASKVFAVAADVLPQTIDVVRTRAAPLGIEVRVVPAAQLAAQDAFAALVQYPGANGDVRDYRELAGALHAQSAHLIVAADRENESRVFDALATLPDQAVRELQAGELQQYTVIRVADEMRIQSAALTEEIHLTNLETRAGYTRERALRNLGLRTGVEEINTFASIMSQADKFGTSIGESLRIFSDDLRHKRQIRAEEQAAKLPTKMLFPLVLCIFPAISMVILGPAGVQIYRVILPMLGGG